MKNLYTLRQKSNTTDNPRSKSWCAPEVRLFIKGLSKLIFGQSISQPWILFIQLFQRKRVHRGVGQKKIKYSTPTFYSVFTREQRQYFIRLNNLKEHNPLVYIEINVLVKKCIKLYAQRCKGIRMRRKNSLKPPKSLTLEIR